MGLRQQARNHKNNNEKILWHLEDSPTICLVLLIFVLLLKAEEKMHVVG